VEVPLRPHVEAAAKHFGLPTEGLAVHQIEFLYEVHQAEGAATFDRFTLER